MKNPYPIDHKHDNWEKKAHWFEEALYKLNGTREYIKGWLYKCKQCNVMKRRIVSITTTKI